MSKRRSNFLINGFLWFAYAMLNGGLLPLIMVSGSQGALVWGWFYPDPSASLELRFVWASGAFLVTLTAISLAGALLRFYSEPFPQDFGVLHFVELTFSLTPASIVLIWAVMTWGWFVGIVFGGLALALNYRIYTYLQDQKNYRRNMMLREEQPPPPAE